MSDFIKPNPSCQAYFNFHLSGPVERTGRRRGKLLPDHRPGMFIFIVTLNDEIKPVLLLNGSEDKFPQRTD